MCNLLLTVAIAQTVDDFRYASPLFKKIDDKGQLIGGVITSGIEASNGMFWFGSQHGLVSFDGYQFKRFEHKTDDANSPAANYIIALAEDDDGNIWIATRTSGLSRYSPSTHQFTHFNTQSNLLTLRTNTLRTLRFDRQGYLWLGHELGVDKIDIKQLTLTPYSFSIANSISFHIFPDVDDSIMVGTTKGVFIKKANEEKFTLVETLLGQNVRSIHRTKKGRYWLGTRSGLRLWDGEGKPYLVSGDEAYEMNTSYIRSIVPLPNGKLWVASYGKGLALFDESSTELIKQFKHDPSDSTSLVFDDVGTTFLSRNGTLFVGTWGAGLQLLNTKMSEHFVMIRHSLKHEKGLSFANVRTILELQDGRLLVGTTGNGLDLIDPKQGRQANIKKSSRGNILSNIVSLAQQENGVVWAGTTASGLLQLDLTTLSLTEGVVSNLVKSSVARLLMLPDQTLIVGTGKGVCKKPLNSSICIELTRPDGSLMNDTVTALLADKYGNAWISSHNGLYRLTPNSIVLDHYQVNSDIIGENSLSHNYIMGMVADSKDKIWLTTSTGFDSVEQLNSKAPIFLQHKTSLGLEKKRPGANMLLDEEGRIWSAITLFDPSNQRFLNFNSELGVDIGTAWLGSFTQLRSGLMAFGGTKGLLIVDPKGLDDNVDSSNLYVTRFKIKGSEQPLARLTQLSLSPNENDISIQVAISDVMRARVVSYQYQLQGEDAAWKTLDLSSREVHYNNLTPGQYSLVFKANYQQFSADITPLNIAITVQPHYWQTWWFKLSLLCLLLVTIFFIFRWRIGIVKAQALQLEEQVSQRTKEIEVINHIGQKFTTQLLLDDLLNDIYQQLSKIFIADRFGIGILTDDSKKLAFNYAVERGVRYHRYERNMHDAGQLAVYAVQHRESILIHDYQQQYQDYYPVADSAQHELASGKKESKALSMMYVPMQQGGAVLGVISIQSTSKNSYKPHDLTLLESLASYASIALMNARSHQDLMALHQTLKLNISELKQTQQQLILNEKMAYLGQLVAGVAHEINTPIGISITAVSLLEDLRADLDENVQNNTLSKAKLQHFLTDSKESLLLIQNNTDRAALLVQRFKQLAEQGVDDRLKEINVAQLCQNVSGGLMHTMSSQAVDINLVVAEQDILQTYPSVLGQVLFILLQNAYLHAFNDQAGIISIVGSQSGQQYILKVSDDGVGIEDKLIAKIFEPFYTTSRHQGGTGLGLSIAFNLVHTSLNGQLNCQSSEGQGTTFEIKLPMQMT